MLKFKKQTGMSTVKRVILVLILIMGKASAKVQGLEIYPMGDIKKMQELPVIFIADNQFNNYLADPNVIRNTIFDNLNPVSIRPPQLDLFAGDITSYVLNKYASGKYIIHLGDALNLACQNEWKVQIDKFNPIKFGKNIHKGWVMLPGNHDAFYYGNTAGNTYFKKGFINRSWRDACNSDSYPPPKDVEIKDVVMTKDIFVKKYFEELLEQGKIYPDDFPKKEDVVCVTTKKATRNTFREKSTKIKICEWKAKNPKSFLQKLIFTLPINQDIRVAYRSYMVQEINLDLIPRSGMKMKGILLDTSDYMRAPRSVVGVLGSFKPFTVFGSYNAGVLGNIDDEQAKLVKSWIKSSEEDSYFVFMGHHPFLNLSPKSKERILEFEKLAPNSLYISSHTHTGFLINSGPVKEVNVGSITDYPNEFVSLYMNFPDPKNDNKLIVFPKRYRETFKEISPDGFCASSDNYTKRGEPYYRYMAYKKESKVDPNSIHDFTLDTLLNALHRTYTKLEIYKNMGNPTLTEFFQKMETLRPCKGTMGKKAKCRAKKFDLLKKISKFDETLYQSDKYRTNRIRYGACQGLWAAYAEYLKDWDKVPYKL